MNTNSSENSLTFDEQYEMDFINAQSNIIVADIVVEKDIYDRYNF